MHDDKCMEQHENLMINCTIMYNNFNGIDAVVAQLSQNETLHRKLIPGD